jgi:ketosteroid isomerase-like protein
VQVPDERLPEESAEAAVETLYEFLHAIGRRDVEAAMDLTAEDYHVMEDDVEVDRLGLRQRLEALLDSLRGWSLEASLAVAPEPLHHPYGVLIAADIQLDAAHRDGSKRSRLERRVALLRQDGEGEWRIHALSLVPE